ncbi:MAG: GNAT family N-acetyltransferase [Thermoleophilia bacterium]|nr:GNAT family N-acetyltransferase [Thermoleophilia bacterium]
MVRAATLDDVAELVDLRREFTFEDGAGEEMPGFEADCRAFLEAALAGDAWQVWVAEVDGRIAGHVFVALVDKVPRPTREHRRIAYLTNVYTRPELRGRGIGAGLVERAQQAAQEADVELMLVWPSDESVDFYRRHGFESPGEPFVWEA